MKTDNYSLIDILEERSLEQFVVPEIQRDYVWEAKDVLDLLSYINEGYSGQKADKPYLGFIYAYNHKDYPYKYFLIDGQQRITTIILLLLVSYHKRGTGLPEYILNRQNLKLEYKVRQATHDFLLSLVTHCEQNRFADFEIEDQIWYHNEYDIDRTIQNVITNFKVIKEWLGKNITDLNAFIKFIEDGIGLSYFDVEESRQGEDLYIYMNSRGRQLEPNETLKARFLDAIADKELWGTKWELWQDFFWKHKGVRPDADAGFNDFLRMAQVLTMSSASSISSDKISAFIRTGEEPSFDNLPPTINGLSAIYDAYNWLVNNEEINKLYLKQGESVDYLTRMPSFDRRQAYFLRILPVLSFLAVSGCREEKIVIRFVRFFYNIARKRQSVGKDISNQLPTAIKLMAEYGSNNNYTFDVCDLANYARGRTVLIDGEEVAKLKVYRNAISEQERQRTEELFWEVEDNKIFDGEISFFLNRYYNKESQQIDLASFKKSWEVFKDFFANSSNDYSKVTIALLYYGYTWVRDSPYYYENYNCRNWYEIVRMDSSTSVMSLLEDLQQKDSSLDTIIKRKIREYFITNKFDTIDSLKSEDKLFNQIKILAALDYYCDKRMFKDSNAYIAKDSRFHYGDPAFFDNRPELFNIGRYLYEGQDGRLMRDMFTLLYNVNKMNSVLSEILTS